MPILLIVLDSGRDKELIGRLAKAIEKYPDFLPLADESYLINTERDSEEVFEAIRRQLGVDANNNDSLIVLTVPQPYIGLAPAKVKLWLAQQNEKYLEVGERALGTFLAD